MESSLFVKFGGMFLGAKKEAYFGGIKIGIMDNEFFSNPLLKCLFLIEWS